MKSFALAFAAAVFLPTVASAQMNGVYGPECVRFWTDVLKKPAPPPRDPIADMRNLYGRFGRGSDPVNFIAESCHMDRALAVVIIKDEVEASGLQQGWNLPVSLPPH